MKIESIIKRDPPTEVTLGDTTYKFQPDDQGRHVAEVTDTQHIARLLSISEGYQLADGEKPLPKTVQKELTKEVEERTKQPTFEPVDENVPKGSTVHPATFEIEGEQVSIEDVIFQAHEASGLTTAEWNELPDEMRHNLIDLALDAMSGEDEQEDDDQSNDNANQGGETTTTATETATEVPAKSPATPEDDKARYDAEREVAAQAYKAKFGKLPHYKWTIEKINEELTKGEGA